MHDTRVQDVRQLDQPAASFRDPAGRVVVYRGRVLRIVNPSGLGDLSAFLDSSQGSKLTEEGKVIGTRKLLGDEVQALAADPALAALLMSVPSASVFEHERVMFPSYPYEWPAEMLFSAAQLTLDLAIRLFPHGIGLKDGTPYNVLFRGPNAVFVDVLSFERRDPRDATWLPYAQFVRTFLLPLLVAKHFGLQPSAVLFTRRDGLEPEEVYRWLSVAQKLSPSFLSTVVLPSWLASKYEKEADRIHKAEHSGDPEKAQFILAHLLKSTARKLNGVVPGGGGKSAWTDYMSTNNNYSADHFAAKEKFVSSAMEEIRPKRVLDIGCNNGHFSEIAARSGAAVVGLDYDPVVLGDVWRRAKANSLDILPLAVNICRPTPAMGWRNEECPSFLQRARGAFDCVLMLAVIHHMLVTERVPLPDIIDTIAEITTDHLILEFVGADDSMFRRIARGRDHLHAGLNEQVFENECRRRFDVVRRQHVSGTERWLYLLRRN